MGISRGTRKQIAAEAVDWFLSLQETSIDELDRQDFSEAVAISGARGGISARGPPGTC